MKRRIWAAWLIVVWLLPFALGSFASAESARVGAYGTGQGWFWKDRPNKSIPETDPVYVPPDNQSVTVGGDIYCYPSPVASSSGSQVCQNMWKTDHFYVGWDAGSTDPLDPPTAEMVSGINFDLRSIPFGSTITKFVMTLKWHPSGAEHNNTPNYDQVIKQGIVACPWPDFYAGTHAAWLDPAYASQRKCGDAVPGRVVNPPPSSPNNADPEYDYNNPEMTFDWQFDLSSIASEWASGENASISLEPTPDASYNAFSWITSFHMDTYTETDPVTKAIKPAPGLYADVTYSPPIEGALGSFSSDGDSALLAESDAPSFSDSGSLAEGLGADTGQPTTTQKPLAAGVALKPIGFWSHIPFMAWLGAFLGLFLIAGSGWLLQAEPEAVRSPGATSALMRSHPEAQKP